MQVPPWPSGTTMPTGRGPGCPAGPSGPIGPSVPVPGVPAGPAGPAGPGGPTGPVIVAPGGPGGPIGPAGPGRPSAPGGPVVLAPGNPVRPIGPAGPTGPAGPGGPGKPRGPIGPVRPGGPCRPRGPGGPSITIGALTSPTASSTPSGSGVGSSPSCSRRLFAALSASERAVTISALRSALTSLSCARRVNVVLVIPITTMLMIADAIRNPPTIIGPVGRLTVIERHFLSDCLLRLTYGALNCRISILRDRV